MIGQFVPAWSFFSIVRWNSIDIIEKIQKKTSHWPVYATLPSVRFSHGSTSRSTMIEIMDTNVAHRAFSRSSSMKTRNDVSSSRM